MFLGAGRTDATPLTPDAPAGVEVREISLAGGFVVLTVEIPTHKPGPHPAIIMPLGDRRALLEEGAVLADFAVQWQKLPRLAGPAPGTPPPPPNTVGVWLLASPSARVIGKAYFGLLAYDGNEGIPRVVDALVALPEVDPERIGISGSSTNGFKALQAATRDARIAVTAVSMTCGDYHRFLEGSTLAMNGTPLDLEPEYDKWLTEQEPLAHAQQLTHTALLTVNGTEDEVVPRACVDTTTERFTRAYARVGHLERFRPVLLTGKRHNLGEQGDQEIMAWWYRWLLRPGPSLPPG